MRATLATLVVGLCAQACHPGAERCVEQTDSLACLSVLGVEPYYMNPDLLTNDVDISMGGCDLGGTIVGEPFSDHSATVRIVNAPPPQLRESPSLAPVAYVHSYSVDYTLNDCPGDAVCPQLEPLTFDGGVSYTIRGGSEVAFSVAMMPLRKKIEFVDELGSLNAYPSYTANYVFAGDDEDGPFTIAGHVEFTVGSFNYCRLLED